MLQVKIFTNTSENNLATIVNEWFANHTNIKMDRKEFYVAPLGQLRTYTYVIVIWYYDNK